MTKKILIVEDDADFAEALAFFLEQHGYAVLKALDGRQGLRLAKRELPDLILMDIIMTERTEGFFTVQEIRHTPELKDIPVFLLTSLYVQAPEFRIQPEACWSAHDEFFAKPVDLNLLLEKIRLRIGPSEHAPTEVRP